jgi:uncharacterized protein (TIGR04255 family)
MSLDEAIRRPTFDRPPVTEVVCGIQFEELRDWRTTHFGQFGSVIGDGYTNSEDQPPAPPLRIEASPITEPPRWSLLPPLRRVFFIKPPGNFLIQLQPTRFLHNWRKVQDTDEYPRYERAISLFDEHWQEFKAFVLAAGLHAPKPEFWELVYVNHIMEEHAKFPQDTWRFLNFYAHNPEAISTSGASGMAMQFIWPLERDAGILSLDLKNGVRASDMRDVLVLELAARGKVTVEESKMLEWFDLAHCAIVNTFEKLTTKEAHTLWGKQE